MMFNASTKRFLEFQKCLHGMVAVAKGKGTKGFSLCSSLSVRRINTYCSRGLSAIIDVTRDRDR